MTKEELRGKGISIEDARKKFGEIEDFYKREEGDIIWWTAPVGTIGVILFSFDKKTLFNIYPDVPDNLSDEQLRVFCRENKAWVEHFSYIKEAAVKRGVI
ncbi:MAG: hypothetical protein LUC44_08565 [Prevotellaceae bacterium]|nr:hypothetical protein [Prevotellaceae bacterium]